MFLKNIRGIRGLGEYQARTPSDWKIDNWIGQPIGGGLQVPVTANGGGISTSTAVEGGIGLVALAAAAWAAWKYFK